MLSLINSKLIVILNKTEEIDLENGPSNSQLEESIIQHLLELDRMLLNLRTEIDDLQEMIQRSLKNKSMSTPDSALDSPGDCSGINASLEKSLLERLDALSQKLTKASASRNSFKVASRICSPTGLGSISSNAQPSPRSIEDSNITNNSEDDDAGPPSPYKGKSGGKKSDEDQR